MEPPITPDCTGLPDPHLAYLTGVLDSIVTEAVATRGRLTLGVATAILILDRQERGIVSAREAGLLFDMAATPVCGVALLTRSCPFGHEWVRVVTNAGESFDLPTAGPSHGDS